MGNEAPRIRWQRTTHLSAHLLYWSLAAVFVLLIGLVRNINLLVLLGYLVVAIPLLNLAAAVQMLRGLHAKRRIAQPIYAGVPCTVSVHIAATYGRARLGVAVEDGGPSHRLRWFAARLGRDGQTFRGQVLLPRRGRCAWGPLTAMSGYPFGLVQRRRILAPAEEVLVLPQLGRLHNGRFRRLVWSRSAYTERRRARPRFHAAAQDQFHGLRPYRTGDNPRAVHWRTTARRGEWMVREFEDLPGDNLVLVFDPAKDGPAFEAAVSLAATIAMDWRSDGGGRLTAAVAGPNPMLLDGPCGPIHARRVLEQLAVVEPAPADEGALVKLLMDAPPGGVVVVGAGYSSVADALRKALQRPVVGLDASLLRDYDFYEPPEEPPSDEDAQ
ncbi:MAG TPA: DUF58 domain-containing protein [Gemmataceae bacterium]|nr:DUF58 domain-containing protein [Gemmataceae bacterium]